MMCSIQDLLDGKIPNEFLKNRLFKYHFIFIHQPTKTQIYPAKIEIYKKTKSSDQETKKSFYDIYKVVNDDEIILRKSEKLFHRNIDIDHFRAKDFNVAQNRGDIIQPIFDEFDNLGDIEAYFINHNDYDKYKKMIN